MLGFDFGSMKWRRVVVRKLVVLADDVSRWTPCGNVFYVGSDGLEINSEQNTAFVSWLGEGSRGPVWA